MLTPLQSYYVVTYSPSLGFIAVPTPLLGAGTGMTT
jgi:hypothetical protein